MFKIPVRRSASLKLSPWAPTLPLILCLLVLLGSIACSSDGPPKQREVKAQQKAEAVQQEVTNEGASAGVSRGEHRQRSSTVVVRNLDTSRKVVALTINACPECVRYTEEILDTLGDTGVKASFGLTGEWAETNSALFKRVVAEGHMLINHTYSNVSFTGFSTDTAPLSFEERAYQLRKAESTFGSMAGVSAKPYFSPPYLDYDASVLRDVYALGYQCSIMATVDTLGWDGATKRQILRRVLDGLEPGTIYLLHAGAYSQDGPALPTIISALRERGYGFVTVDDYCPR